MSLKPWRGGITHALKNRMSLKSAKSLRIEMSKIAVIVLSLALFFGPFSAQASAPSCLSFFRIKSVDRRLSEAKNLGLRTPLGVNFVQIIAPAKKSFPTLLLLPGVNLLMAELNLRALVEKGFGVVSVQFSSQAFSVNQLETQELKSFRERNPSMQDYANETTQIVNYLNEDLGIKNIIPVGLSFSGAISAQLKGFPLIIESVPMTSTKAAVPMADQFRSMLKAAESLNPFLGPTLSRSAIDQAYHSVSANRADSMIAKYHFSAEKRADFALGFTKMAHASEDFDWKNLEIPKETARVMIVAAKEDSLLLKDQILNYQRLVREQYNIALIIFSETGHIIPQEQPEAYAQVLNMIVPKSEKLRQANAPLSGVMIMDPSTGVLTQLSASAADELLAKLTK